MDNPRDNRDRAGEGEPRLRWLYLDLNSLDPNLRKALDGKKPGDEFLVKVMRDKAKVEAKVLLTKRQ